MALWQTERMIFGYENQAYGTEGFQVVRNGSHVFLPVGVEFSASGTVRDAK